MAGNARQVINMANSIVGVSILSMPFCFKETGLLLGVVLVLVSGFITKKTCMFLIRSAIMARRRSYEFLAFHVFGVSGKIFVEMCMILFLIGICISFHVVMGDLAPTIVARFMNIENSSSLRCTLLIGIAILVILPLCLLRNLDNLASMSACSIMFYFFLVTVVFWHAFPKLWDGSWIHMAELWRPAGALQVLPILSLSLACQSNVFEIYDSVPDPDVPKMRFVVNHAVNLCSALYISVGFLGYVAFVDKDFSGNIIMSFPNSELTEGIKVFFTVSLAISFPLMIFPCRTSIHSLLYRRSNPSSFDLVGNYMPEARFKAITLGIMFSSLVIGIIIPNIEFVLGLLGSTMGMMIALILPSLLFIKVNTKASTERLLAQAIMLMGLMLVVTGTYLNVSHIYQVQTEVQIPPTELMRSQVEPQLPKIDDKVVDDVKKDQAVFAVEDSATRKEPVAPEPPPEEDKSIQKEKVKNKAKDPGKDDNRLEEKDSKKEEGKVGYEKEKKKLEEGSNVKKDDSNKSKIEGDILHPDAIQKEEKVNEEEIDKDQDDKNIEKKQAEILEKMAEQHQEQQQILEEQKKILQELKDQKLKQEEDAKKQEENKGNAVEAGNVAALVDVQQPDIVNPAVPGEVQQGVEMLVGPQLKLIPNVESNAYQQVPGDKDGIPAVYVNQPGQNVQLGNQPGSVSVPAVELRLMADGSVNQPVIDLGPKINPQLPMMYYHGNSPNLVVNPVVSNQVNNPPSMAIPVANQQLPAANLPGQALPAGNPAGQPAFVANPAGQAAVAANYAAQPAPAANLPAQPGLVANPPVQSGPVANPPVQSGPVANLHVQPAVAAQPGPVANLPIQPVVAAQPGPVANIPVQPAVAAQPGPVVNTPVQHVALNPAGEHFVSNLAGQAVPAANFAAQPAPGFNGASQGIAAANVAGQPLPGANFAGQPAVGLKGHNLAIASANLIGQPVAVGNVAVQPVAAANLPGQAAHAENLPIELKERIKSRVDTPVLPQNRRPPSLKFEDDTNQKSILQETISQHAGEKLSKLSEDSKVKAAGKGASKKEVAQNKIKASEKKETSNKSKTRKKSEHDEERRKRQVDGDGLDLPQVEMFRELKWKDFGDVAYDTRHLLWTGRSRRKKRNKGRDEDYYWDET